MSIAPVVLDADLVRTLGDLASDVAQPYREAVAGLSPADAVRELEQEARQVFQPLGVAESAAEWAQIRDAMGADTDAQWAEQLCILIAMGLMTQRAVDDLAR